MTEAITRYEEKPLTAQDIRGQVGLLQDVMKTVMQEGQHFGKIQGLGDKPVLFKSGAEKIMSTFRLAADPEVEDISTEGVIRYRVKCRMISASGRFMGAGVGEASTGEDKFMWRAAISKEEFDITPENQRRIKYTRKGNIQQVRTNPFDLANTILKMAKKRALIDAVLTVTAASDIFTQDIEELPQENIDKDKTPQPPQSPQPQTQGQDKITPGQVKLIHAKLKNAGITENDFKTHFGIGHISDLPKNRISEALEAIAEGLIPSSETETEEAFE